MRQEVLIQLIRKIKSKPALLRKVKIFLVVGFVGLVLTGVLAIWAGVAAFQFAATHANRLMESPVAQAQIADVKQKAQQGLASFEPLSCWMRAQSLMSVEPWLGRPLLENLNNLKVACLGNLTQSCEEGSECPQDQNSKSNEGSTI